jgi:hypothetical protein
LIRLNSIAFCLLLFLKLLFETALVKLYTIEKAKADALNEARAHLEAELDDIARELATEKYLANCN